MYVNLYTIIIIIIIMATQIHQSHPNNLDLISYLTRNNTKIWYRQSTNINNNQNNTYCSICCMNIRNTTIGKHCGRHTMCQYKKNTYGPACRGYVNIPFTDEEKEALVDAHNTIRNIVAVGMESRGNPGPQPTAANMRALQWDNELEEVAKRWAAQCIFARDQCRDVSRYPVGQNIARGNYALTNDLSFIADWYGNVAMCTVEDITHYRAEATDALSLYTQLVWAETYQMGCARVAFQSANGSSVFYKEHFICNYGPTGNIPGQAVYKLGEPCSACPQGTACTVEYGGLCGSETVFAVNFKKAKSTPISSSRSGFLLASGVVTYRIVVDITTVTGVFVILFLYKYITIFYK